MSAPLLVLLGGAIGAPVRYVVDRWVQARLRSAFPWGTFAVNVAGSLLLGLIAAAGPTWLVTLAGTGFCGALTTFSTFSVEVIRLLEERRVAVAGAYVVASLVVGLAAFALGYLALG